MYKQEILGLTDPKACCGCGACAAACPVDAITMVPKILGAYYPEVNTDKCISCGKCRKVCVFQTEDKLQNLPLKTYAAANADSRQLKNSASGGVFAALARKILAQGGIVYGCSMERVDGKLTPMHIGVETEAQLRALQGSKYVQSKTARCFKEVKAQLQKDRTVFFSGTPCQVAALKCYLQGTNTEKLFTADLVCHGAPGTALFQAYIEHLEKQKNVEITKFSFRDKSLGWSLLARYWFQTKGGKEKSGILEPRISSYYDLFERTETLRESCYFCPWAQAARVGDITLGDYWGFETEHPELLAENGGRLTPNAGVSVVLVNTPRGEDLLRQYGEDLIAEQSLLERAVRWNIQLQRPSRHTRQREAILACYEEKGYAGIEKHFRSQKGLRYYVGWLKNKVKEIRAKQ